jgi:acetylornithine deacetylase/succinyl-diaminopimelate desuccinylase-like protein
VQALAGQIGERNLRRAGSLDAAARYLQGTLRDLGFAVEAQEFEVEKTKVVNLESALVGGALHDQILLVGAHYDSVVGSPGANDNGTGAAAVLELARLLAHERLPRTLRFVLFVNEEPPYYLGDAMGSRRYAKRCRAR